MVNFTPFDTFGRSSRRQVGFITAERASRAARAAEARRADAVGHQHAAAAATPRIPVAWSYAPTGDRSTTCTAYVGGTERVGRVYSQGDRYFAQVTYPEPGNTASVVLPGSYDQTPAGRQKAKRAVEDALATRAAARRSFETARA